MYRYYELGKKRGLFRGGYWDPFLLFLSTRCEVNTRCKPGALAYGLGCSVGVLDQNQAFKVSGVPRELPIGEAGSERNIGGPPLSERCSVSLRSVFMQLVPELRLETLNPKP